MNEPHDRELVNSCIRHDRQAWERFVDRYANYIYSVVRTGLKVGHYPHSTEDAEDIFAEVFLSLVEKDYHLLRVFEWRCSLKTWLWVIARKKVIRHFRKKGIKTIPIPAAEASVEKSGNPGPFVSSETGPSDAAHAEEKKAVLEETLKELSDRDRLCLVLYFYDGLSYKEIAKVVEVPANHVGILIHRAKKRLEKGLLKKGLPID
ncbi:MAG: RNA polymerase sigma factor [Planctomycetota bacterium]